MAETRSQSMSLVQLSLLGLGLGLLLVLGLFLQLYDASEKAVMKSADLLADLENSTTAIFRDSCRIPLECES